MTWKSIKTIFLGLTCSTRMSSLMVDIWRKSSICKSLLLWYVVTSSRISQLCWIEIAGWIPRTILPTRSVPWTTGDTGGWMLEIIYEESDRQSQWPRKWISPRSPLQFTLQLCEIQGPENDQLVFSCFVVWPRPLIYYSQILPSWNRRSFDRPGLYSYCRRIYEQQIWVGTALCPASVAQHYLHHTVRSGTIWRTWRHRPDGCFASDYREEILVERWTWTWWCCAAPGEVIH